MRYSDETVGSVIVPFPYASNSAGRRALRKELLKALRVSGAPVIVDLSGSSTLNHEDIDLLLECTAQVVARDTQVRLVADSRVNRMLLEVTRISSLVPIFNSVEEALANPSIAAESYEEQRSSQSQSLWSA